MEKIIKPPFWHKKWGTDKVCGITHTRLRPGKNREGIPYTITLKCRHSFYRIVLTEWVKKCYPVKPTCPNCRTEFDSAILFLK